MCACASGYLDVPKCIFFLLKFRIEHQNMQMAFFFFCACAWVTIQSWIPFFSLASSYFIVWNFKFIKFLSTYTQQQQSERKKRIKRTRMTYRIKTRKLIIAALTHIGLFFCFPFFISGRSDQSGQHFQIKWIKSKIQINVQHRICMPRKRRRKNRSQIHEQCVMCVLAYAVSLSLSPVIVVARVYLWVLDFKYDKHTIGVRDLRRLNLKL